jgi:hypothetical protein
VEVEKSLKRRKVLHCKIMRWRVRARVRMDMKRDKEGVWKGGDREEGT